jgi:hypothetical protein
VARALDAKLGGSQHADALVIVDNLHFADARLVRKLSNYLLGLAGAPCERHVILLAQERAAWRAQPADDSRLVAAAERDGRLHRLERLTFSDVDFHFDELSRLRLNTLRSVSSDDLPTIGELRAVSFDVPAAAGEAQTLQVMLQHLFPADPSAYPASSYWFSDVLGVAAALALYTGIFFESEFRSARRYDGVIAGIVARRLARRALRRLQILPTFLKSSLPGQPYLLEERLAEYLQDSVGRRDRAFRLSFDRAMRWRSAAYGGESPELRWLAAVELASIDEMESSFDAALLTGSLETMARRLQANFTRVDSPSAHYQLGIILDRVGAFDQARIHLRAAKADAASGTLSEDVDLALLEAEHGPVREGRVAQLLCSDRHETRFAARYWQMHMAGHQGRFDADGFIKLAAQLTEEFPVASIRESSVLTRLSSRVFFDASRHVFLERRQVRDRLSDLWSLPVRGVLAECDSTFRARHALYFSAHVKAFVSVPEIIFGEYRPRGQTLSYDDTVNPGGPPASSKDVLAAYALVQHEFETIGDREAKYLSGDIINARVQTMPQELLSLKSELAAYRGFIEGTNFGEVASYPDFYASRLSLAHWRQAIDQEAFDEADAALDEAYITIEAALKKDEICENQFGLWRGRFYLCLLEELRRPRRSDGSPLSVRLEELQRQASNLGYDGDARFISKLLEMNRPQYVYYGLMFHPFVHQ